MSPRLPGALALAVLLPLWWAAGCHLLLDVDHIEFGDTSAGGTAAGGAGGGPGGEDCTNGSDDDGDGAVDCGDDDCSAGFRCVPQAPVGWQGPVAIYVGAAATPAPSCGSSWGTERVLNGGAVTAPDATCNSCTCGAPTGGSCGLPTISIYDGAMTCSGLLTTLSPAAAGTCYTFGLMGGGSDTAMSSAVPVANDGSCPPSGGGVATLPAPSWELAAVVCSDSPASAGGCGATTRCAPSPAAPFTIAFCISQDGDVACPAEFPDRTLVYAGVMDGRGCSACGCGSPNNRTCSGTVSLWPSSSCTGIETQVPANGSTCVPFTSLAGTNSYQVATSGPSGGSCNDNGGNANGNVTPDQPVTVCCEAGAGVGGAGGAGGAGAGGN